MNAKSTDPALYLLPGPGATPPAPSSWTGADGWSAPPREFPQVYPQPGWVEHDARLLFAPRRRPARRRSGRPASPRRTWPRSGSRTSARRRSSGSGRGPAPQRDRLAGPPDGGPVRAAPRRGSGRIDPGEDGAGARPLLLRRPSWNGCWTTSRGRGRGPNAASCCFGTVDTWLLSVMTDGRAHRTDRTNASRDHALEPARGALGRGAAGAVPDSRTASSPEVLPSAAPFGEATGFSRKGIPVTGIAGDQQAALFGQAGLVAGDRQEHLRDRAASCS